MPKFIRSQRSNLATLRTLDTRPDDSDARDYIFRPTLDPLLDSVDHRRYAPILDQKSEGACVGFALATVIHVSMARRAERLMGKRPRKIDQVSPRMLYEMARRYDEWKGEDYEGTSLRGAIKGWHKHGVTTDRHWPYLKNGKPAVDRALTPDRAQDAARRPIGAYYRIIDSDVSHVQAAICEGDAVLASAYVHPGWHNESLQNRSEPLKVIPPQLAKRGLHAFAIIGYTKRGFIIQNSWGSRWGTNGCALLSYDDWFANRQDAWVARPAPEACDLNGKPKLWVIGFSGQPEFQPAGTSAQGLDIDTNALPYFINTGDRGELSEDGSLTTRRAELPGMARRVLMAAPDNRGVRHIMLYAHGGLNSETLAAQTASRIWCSAAERKLTSYFFIWESGMTESVWGWLKSDDDATGPAGFSWEDAWESVKKGAGKIVRKTQKMLGEGLAPIVRTAFWNEMKGRVQGASRPKGGAALFLDELFGAIATTPGEAYKIHLVGHSAGSMYLGWLFQQKLASLINQSGGNVTLGSIQLMAPAITLQRTQQAFKNGRWPVDKTHFGVYMLKPDDENADNIQIYPSSLLTYVADCLEDDNNRVPLLGIRDDFMSANVDFATPIQAPSSVKHGEFDDAHHEIELILDDIANGKFS